MARSEDANTSSGSTTWAWKQVKMRPSPARATRTSGGARRFRGLQRRDAKSRLTLTIAYKGGSEAWYVVEARGRTAAFPGHRALHDVMREINREY